MEHQSRVDNYNNVLDRSHEFCMQEQAVFN